MAALHLEKNHVFLNEKPVKSMAWKTPEFLLKLWWFLSWPWKNYTVPQTTTFVTMEFPLLRPVEFPITSQLKFS